MRQPPNIFRIPSRAILTNGVVYFQDRSIYPALPAVPATLELLPSLSVSFNALGNFDAYLEGCVPTEPPDSHGAVGTSHLLTLLNTGVRIQGRNGSNLQSKCSNDWWIDEAQGIHGANDPRVLYDSYFDRWIAVGMMGFGTNSALVMAVSRTNDPTLEGTNGWHFVRVKADTDTPETVRLDQPNVGFNKHWVVVHGNMWTFSGGSTPEHIERSHFWVFNKTNLYAGGTSHRLLKYGTATNAGAIIPAVTYDTNLSILYLLQNANGPAGCLRLFSITGALGSETLNLTNNAVYIQKPGYTWADLPPNSHFLPQGGSTNKIRPVDSRLHNVVYRNGCLWAPIMSFWRQPT